MTITDNLIRRYVIAAFCCSLAACTAPPGSLYWNSNRFLQAPDRADADQLLLDENGWQVWRLIRRFDATCVAFKPAAEQPKPSFSGDFGVVNGGTGFYMVIESDWRKPYFGLYGAHTENKVVFVDYRGDKLRSVDDRDLVLGWEGEEIEYQITTQPSAQDYRSAETQSGRVNFTGIETAYQALMACYQYSR